MKKTKISLFFLLSVSSILFSCSNVEVEPAETETTISFKLENGNGGKPNEAFPNNQWVLVNIPCEEKSKLVSLRIGCYIVDPAQESSLALCIGRYDSVNHIILKPRVFYIELTHENANYSKIDGILELNILSNNILINEGECLALYSYSKTNVRLYKSSNYSGKCLCSSESPYFIPKSLFSECNDISCFEYTVKLNYSEIPQYPNAEDSAFTSFRLFSRIAFIGTSYVQHAKIEDWKVEKPRSMAASVDETSFVNLIMREILRNNPNAKYSCVNDGVWQRNYKDFDYESVFGEQLRKINPDLVFLVTGGNSTYTSDFQASFSSYLNYLKQQLPNSELVVVIGWYTTQKRNDMLVCCEEQGVKYVDLIDINEASMRWRMGDWYKGIDGNGDNNTQGLYGFSSTKVVGLHANDLGFCIAADRCLQKAEAGKCNNYIHGIHLTKKGDGVVSTPNLMWVTGGLVSLRIDEGQVSRITIKDSNENHIQSLKLSNNFSGSQKDYYTFFMPDSNVEVFVEFESV